MYDITPAKAAREFSAVATHLQKHRIDGETRHECVARWLRVHRLSSLPAELQPSPQKQAAIVDALVNGSAELIRATDKFNELLARFA